MVVRFIPEQTQCFNTRMRTPLKIVFETIRFSEAKARRSELTLIAKGRKEEPADGKEDKDKVAKEEHEEEKNAAYGGSAVRQNQRAGGVSPDQRRGAAGTPSSVANKTEADIYADGNSNPFFVEEEGGFPGQSRREEERVVEEIEQDRLKGIEKFAKLVEIEERMFSLDSSGNSLKNAQIVETHRSDEGIQRFAVSPEKRLLSDTFSKEDYNAKRRRSLGDKPLDLEGPYGMLMRRGRRSRSDS